MLNGMIGELTKQITEIDKEQYTQNKEIMELMRNNMQHGEMLLQHIEILKYLVEQDPMLSKQKRWIVPVGEA
jgi:hypothetical protein